MTHQRTGNYTYAFNASYGHTTPTIFIHNSCQNKILQLETVQYRSRKTHCQISCKLFRHRHVICFWLPSAVMLEASTGAGQPAFQHPRRPVTVTSAYFFSSSPRRLIPLGIVCIPGVGSRSFVKLSMNRPNPSSCHSRAGKPNSRTFSG